MSCDFFCPRCVDIFYDFCDKAMPTNQMASAIQSTEYFLRSKLHHSREGNVRRSCMVTFVSLSTNIQDDIPMKDKPVSTGQASSYYGIERRQDGKINLPLYNFCLG